jgi:hypothetical protein
MLVKESKGHLITPFSGTGEFSQVGHMSCDMSTLTLALPVESIPFFSYKF